MIFHRTPEVPALSDYHQYRDPYLRPDFQYRCAYCLIKEGLFLEEAGLRFLDPCAEDHREHWDVEPDGTLRPKTGVGQYTIINIHLDRRFLNTMRRRFAERKRRVARAQEKLAASGLSPEDRAFIEALLADDFLVDVPAFVE